MRYTEFEYGKYYSSFSLSQHKLCITIGDDFRYKLFVYNDGYYHLIDMTKETITPTPDITADVTDSDCCRFF